MDKQIIIQNQAKETLFTCRGFLAKPRQQQRSATEACGWPSLSELSLAAAASRARMTGVGGSDANVILSGDEERILRLWREKRGEAQSEDLSSRISVALGSWTEAFNRQWYEKLTGQRVTGVGRCLTSTRHPWRRCTLDGVIEVTGGVFEAKHTIAL